MSRRPQLRRPGSQLSHLVPISRRPRFVQRPRVLPPYRQPQQPQQRPTRRPTIHVPANRRILSSDPAPPQRPTLPANRIQDYHTTHWQYPDNSMRTSSLTSLSAQPPPDDESFQDDQCNMIQMDDSAIDDALNTFQLTLAI